VRSTSRLAVGVLLVVTVDLLLQLHGCAVERVMLISNGSFASGAVEEILVDSHFMVLGVLVVQRMEEVLSLGEVKFDGILVELVLLVFQSLLVVSLVFQVSFSLLVVLEALGQFVVRTALVSKSFLQVLRLAEVLPDSVSVVLAFGVNKLVVVECGVFLEFNGEDLPQVPLVFLVLGEETVLVVCAGEAVPVGLVSGMSRQGSLGSSRRLRGGRRLRSGSRCSLTSLEVLKIFSSLKVQGLKVTSIKGEIFTSLQVLVVELAGRKLVINLTGLDILLYLTGEGGSNSRSTEKSDSKESDFRSVFHDVWIISLGELV